jgi:hypothetical protein
MSVYTPDIYVTLGSGNALGESTAVRLPNNKHLIVIGKAENVVTSHDGTVTINLGTKEEAIKALRYAIERLER